MDTKDIKDHNDLFATPEYQAQFEAKKEFENGCGSAEVARVSEWTQSDEYRELNFARDMDMTVNSPVWSLVRDGSPGVCDVPEQAAG